MLRFSNKKIIIALLLITFLQKKFASKSCTFVTLLNSNIIDCTNENLREIPPNLPNNCTHLVLNNNPLKKIGKSEIENFTNLTKFIFTNDVPNQMEEIDPGAFAASTNLIMLESVNNNFGDVTLIFPPNIVEIKITRAGLTNQHLNVSYLKKLRKLNLESNSLSEFPILDKKCPIVEMNLRNNSVKSIPMEKLARYCDLNDLQIRLSPDSPTLNEYCQCTKLYEWILTLQIEGIEPEKFTCVQDGKCSEPGVTLDMKNEYNTCLLDSGREPFFLVNSWMGDPRYRSKVYIRFILLILLLSLLVTIFAFVYLLILYRKAKETVRTGPVEPKREPEPEPEWEPEPDFAEAVQPEPEQELYE